MRSLYLDDFASGSENVTTAVELSRKVKHRLASGGFNKRKWLSNYKDLMTQFLTDPEFVESPQTQLPTAEEDQGYSQTTLGYKFASCPRTLGQAWDIDNGKIGIGLYKLMAEVDHNVTTKRMVLSSAAKFYDPLGLISPVILLLKLLFQELCNKKVA